MTELEARVRCLEVAATLSVPDRDVKTVVKIATDLYTFAVAAPEAETPKVPVDKSSKGKKAAVPDILS